jgi:amino acid adenylation domain-containing protein
MTDRASSRHLLPFGPPDAEQSLVRRFEQQVDRHASRLAARVGAASITYGELERAGNRVAHALRAALGEGPEPVAMLLGPGLEQIAAHLGVLKSGKACVPLDPAQPQPRLARILAETGARLLLTDGPRRSRAGDLADGRPEKATAATEGGLGSRPAVLDVSALPTSHDERPRATITPDTLAYVFYTAGSTGEAKGVMQNHRNLLQLARLYHEEIGFSPEDRILCPMPLVYAGGVWGLLGAIASGASLHRAAMEGAGALPTQISEGAITVAQLMTSMLRQLLREVAPGARFPSLRLVYTGGEVLHPADVTRFREVFPDCTLLYDLGSTEAGLICHFRIDAGARPDGHVHHRDGTALVPVGFPLPGVELLILDDGGRPVTPGSAGQIAVRSEFLSPGYWRDPERTDAAFLADTAGGTRRIYLTGDVGAMLPDGRFLHFGRTDLLTKIRGQRVGAGEIEAALRDDPAVTDAAVVARDDAGGDARLVAYVACAPGHPLTVSALRRRLAAVLPASMIPSAFVLLDALPLSPVGKVDRAALPEPGRSRPPLEVAYVAPRTRLEETLADAWAEALELDEVGVDDHFLELGGHSLAATRLVFRLNEQLGVELPVSHLFEAPTVAAQSRTILDFLAARLPDAELERLLGRIETS